MISTQDIVKALLLMKRYPNVRLATDDAATLKEAAEMLEVQDKHIAHLQKMLDKLSTWTGGGIEVSLDAWRAADKDAKRYRWLREGAFTGQWQLSEVAGTWANKMDATIDRAMSEAALDKMREISEELKLP